MKDVRFEAVVHINVVLLLFFFILYVPILLVLWKTRKRLMCTIVRF